MIEVNVVKINRHLPRYTRYITMFTEVYFLIFAT